MCFRLTEGPAIDCCEYVAVLIADLKLLVDGGCRTPVWEGGMLEPCCLVPKTLRLGMDNAEPRAGLVARWISSGGGGERGRPGGRSGMKFGGPIEPVGGGGCLGGGGRIIIGGRDLSTGADKTLARGASSTAAERVDSID